MVQDKYSAVWVSHSSISDFLACPRAYFLKNIYKNPKTGHKMTLMSPPLALGQVVHEVIESLSHLPVENRFQESLITKLENVWQKITGKLGGFKDKDHESYYKDRAQNMLKKVMDHPGPLKNLSVKIKSTFTPNFWLSEADNIILNGKIDWLEYLPETDSVHIIDFKTGKNDERPDSLQLPIYYLLATSTQTHPVTKASYWYIDRSSSPTEQKLPDKDKSYQKILKIAKAIKLARQLNRFPCPHQGCSACKPLEAILNHEAEYVGLDNLKRDVYIFNSAAADLPQSEIL